MVTHQHAVARAARAKQLLKPKLTDSGHTTANSKISLSFDGLFYWSGTSVDLAWEFTDSMTLGMERRMTWQQAK